MKIEQFIAVLRVVLVPTYSLPKNLSSAQMEQDAMRGMIVQRGLEDVSPPQPAWGSVIDLLERGGYDF